MLKKIVFFVFSICIVFAGFVGYQISTYKHSITQSEIVIEAGASKIAQYLQPKNLGLWAENIFSVISLKDETERVTIDVREHRYELVLKIVRQQPNEILASISGNGFSSEALFSFQEQNNQTTVTWNQKTIYARPMAKLFANFLSASLLREQQQNLQHLKQLVEKDGINK